MKSVWKTSINSNFLFLFFVTSGVEHELVQLKAALRQTQPNVMEMKEKVAYHVKFLYKTRFTIDL